MPENPGTAPIRPGGPRRAVRHRVARSKAVHHYFGPWPRAAHRAAHCRHCSWITKTDERAVLLGTRSFWEGVDIPGESLSALVIVRRESSRGASDAAEYAHARRPGLPVFVVDAEGDPVSLSRWSRWLRSRILPEAVRRAVTA